MVRLLSGTATSSETDALSEHPLLPKPIAATRMTAQQILVKANRCFIMVPFTFPWYRNL